MMMGLFAPKPRVSVVMPVLNPHPVFFRQAVASVLGQTHQDLELVIVEDPSERSAAGLLDGLADGRVRHVRNPRRTSFADQLNRGLAEARADLVARLDADDVCEPDRLGKQLDYLGNHPDVAVLGSQLAVIDTRGRRVGFRPYPLGHDAILEALPRYCPLAHPAVLFHKSAVLEADGYRRCRHAGTEDYELWSRLARRGLRFANHPEPLLRYRIHPQGMKSARLRDLLAGTLAIKQEYWADRMGWPARARVWAERLLLRLPPRLVLSLFLRTQYRKALPTRRAAAGPLALPVAASGRAAAS
jgi:glycosyltransferase involved in cell wall biosynthesis